MRIFAADDVLVLEAAAKAPICLLSAAALPMITFLTAALNSLLKMLYMMGLQAELA